MIQELTFECLRDRVARLLLCQDARLHLTGLAQKTLPSFHLDDPITSEGQAAALALVLNATLNPGGQLQELSAFESNTSTHHEGAISEIVAAMRLKDEPSSLRHSQRVGFCKWIQFREEMCAGREQDSVMRKLDKIDWSRQQSEQKSPGAETDDRAKKLQIKIDLENLKIWYLNCGQQ